MIASTRTTYRVTWLEPFVPSKHKQPDGWTNRDMKKFKDGPDGDPVPPSKDCVPCMLPSKDGFDSLEAATKFASTKIKGWNGDLTVIDESGEDWHPKDGLCKYDRTYVVKDGRFVKKNRRWGFPVRSY